MTQYVFSRDVGPMAGELRFYLATSPEEACTMLERALAGTDDDPANWSDAQVTCDKCGALMLHWQHGAHACN